MQHPKSRIITLCSLVFTLGVAFWFSFVSLAQAAPNDNRCLSSEARPIQQNLPADLTDLQSSPPTTPTTPSNITCLGYGENEVWFRWNFPATEPITNFRVELQSDGGSWQQIDTVTIPDDPWNVNGQVRLTHKHTDNSVEPYKRRYRVRAYRRSDDKFSDYSKVCNGRRNYETENVRLFYGIKGTDDCPGRAGGSRRACLSDVTNSAGNNLYAQRAAEIVQGSINALERIGYGRSAGQHPSLDKIPINAQWCDGGGCASGNSRGMGLAPEHLETTMSKPKAWVTSLHETFHFQQYRYWGISDPDNDWVVEGQARMSQDKVCIGGDRDNCTHFDDAVGDFAGISYLDEVNNYLTDPANDSGGDLLYASINRRDYQAALFWAYLLEKYGTSPGDDVEDGMNFLVTFWEDSANNAGRDGIAIIDSTLSELGHSASFEDVWKDFAVANYAKDYDSQTKYQYADANTSEPGGNYKKVGLAVDQFLDTDEQIVRPGESLAPWTARYYEIQPSTDLAIVDFQVIQDSGSPVYYTLMALDIDGQVMVEENQEARHFDYTLVNNEYHRVMLMVASLKNHANYRLSINGTQPQLRIVSPTFDDKVRVGAPTAPEKFRVIVEVLGPDGTPLEGVTADNFEFQVGDKSIPESQQLTSAEIMDQFWFLLRAPTQDSPGTYDLQVEYSTALSDIEVNAVQYQPRDAADNVIVVDHSGSMSEEDKMPSAKAAAKVYVDSWNSNDKIGVIGFDSSLGPRFNLTDWDSSSRDNAINTIDNMTADRGTAIGDAVRAGWNDLDNNGTDDHEWALILLSDGMETAGSEDFGTVIDDLVSSRRNGDKVPVVHTVAVGPDADQARMQRASRRTNGRYRYVAAPASASARQDTATQIYFDLTETYRQIATEVSGQQQFFAENNTLTTGAINNTHDVPIQVENGASALVVSLNIQYLTNFINVDLKDPNGNDAPGIRNEGPNHFVWQITNPMGGEWTLEIEPIISGRQTVSARYQAQAAVKSEVTMELFLTGPTDDPVAGLPVTILTSLTDNGPISGATVEATITPQAAGSEPTTLTLFDDGQHNDGAAGDGLYGAIFRDTTTLAPHIVSVVADGQSSISGPFHRELEAAFYPTHNDDDNDGLPNEWEIEYGLAPNQANETQDPDFDGLPNENEYNTGTDPFNPDTDGDGITDGSDFEPLIPAQDAIAEIRAMAHPGNGQLVINYTQPQTYARIDIYRSQTVAGDYSSVAGFLGEEATGSYTDTTVTNGQMYCYILIARDFNFQESQTAATCATPRGDYIDPHGLVMVQNTNNQNQVPNPNVTLELWASDLYLPESLDPGQSRSVDSEASGVVEMKISNQSNLADANWQPYVTSRQWDLGVSQGQAKVYAQYRDGAGNTSRIYADMVEVTEEARVTADLMVHKTASPEPVTVNQPLTYTLTISNNGPDIASSVRLTDTLPSGVTLAMASPSCQTTTGTVSCNVGNLQSGESNRLQIIVTPTEVGTIQNRVVISSATTDETPANNQQTVQSTVQDAQDDEHNVYIPLILKP